MSSPKIILYKHKTYSDGLHPIIIQVVVKGKPIRKVIARCSEKDWLKSKSRVSPRHIEAPRINNEIEIALKNFGLNTALSLKDLFQQQIDKFKVKQQVSRYQINLRVFTQLFEYKPTADFKDINETFIYGFVEFLNNSSGTIKEKMNVLRAVIRQARQMKLMIENPFEYITFPSVKSSKSKLTIEEIKLIQNAKICGKQEESRDIFMCCIYLRGLRVGDMLTMKEENIIDGRLHFTESKTGKKNNLAISEDVLVIFNKWRGKNKLGFIFNFMDNNDKKDLFYYNKRLKIAVTTVSRHIKELAKELGITKNVSTHTARHSFSRLANATIKDTSITKNLIGHSSLAVHERYISEITDDVIMDGYAKQVLDQLK